jgi:hypothetical protein
MEKEGVMATQEPVTRQYRMLCQRCNHTWEATYVIRTLHDDAGDHELFYRGGAPAIDPAAAPARTAAAYGYGSFPATRQRSSTQH